MVKIRLRRVGAKKQPSFRVVVADSRSPRDGRFIEVIGFYNPRTEPETATIQEDRALYWLDVGAQPTRAVQRLLVKQGTWSRFERLKQGENLADLLEEAAAEAEAPAAVEADALAEETPPQEPEPTEDEEVEEKIEETIDAAEDEEKSEEEAEDAEPSDDEENEETGIEGEGEEAEEPAA